MVSSDARLAAEMAIGGNTYERLIEASKGSFAFAFLMGARAMAEINSDDQNYLNWVLEIVIDVNSPAHRRAAA